MSNAHTTQIAITTAAGFMEHFGVSRETGARLQIYADELARWQKTINLVAPSTLPDMWQRHFADSAQVVAIALRRMVDPGAPGSSKDRPWTWVDLGSGGGFPGLVAAIMLSPELITKFERLTRVTLVESDSRKAAFLRNVARLTGTPVDILCERAEQAATRTNLGSADFISARALAPLTRLFEWSAPFVAPGTVLLLPKGRDLVVELQGAEKQWKFDCELVPSITDPEARIAVVTRLARRR